MAVLLLEEFERPLLGSRPASGQVREDNGAFGFKVAFDKFLTGEAATALDRQEFHHNYA